MIECCSKTCVEKLLQKVRDHESKIIVISGGTNSGKTTLARSLSRRLSDFTSSVIVPLDHFFRDHNDANIPRNKFGQIFDLPDSYHGAEFCSVVLKLASGESVFVPVYNLAENRREEKRHFLKAASVTIAEGLYASHFLRQAGECVRIFLDLPVALCRERRILSEMKMNGVSKEQASRRFDRMVMPYWEKIVQLQKSQADIVVDNN